MKNLTPDEIVRSLTTKLRQLREEKGLSMNALAQKAGLDQVAVSRIEKGERSPQLRTVLMICSALSVSLEDILKTVSTTRKQE